MVLALARPEVHELFPGLWSQRSLTEMRLTELSPRASEKLVRSVLAGSATDDVVRSLVQRAEGNAFYLEELIRSAAEGHGAELPGSVLAMIKARLERLEGEGARRFRRESLRSDVLERRVVLPSAVAERTGDPHAGEARGVRRKGGDLRRAREGSLASGVLFPPCRLREAAYGSSPEEP